MPPRALPLRVPAHTHPPAGSWERARTPAQGPPPASSASRRRRPACHRGKQASREKSIFVSFVLLEGNGPLFLRKTLTPPGDFRGGGCSGCFVCSSGAGPPPRGACKANGAWVGSQTTLTRSLPGLGHLHDRMASVLGGPRAASVWRDGGDTVWPALRPASGSPPAGRRPRAAGGCGDGHGPRRAATGLPRTGQTQAWPPWLACGQC